MSSGIHGPVMRRYQDELQQRGYTADVAQLQAIAALERCAQDWAQYKNQRSNTLKRWLNKPELPQGVYMYGGVGRGKSFLMDCFFDAVAIRRKTRLHFHEFMREVHRELAALQGQSDPLDILAERMSKRFKLICFDEFHISDVTDAMILHRLLSALFKHGVGFVTTSNFHPDALYPDGLHRDRLLPAMQMLKQRLDVVNVDNGTDYRSQTLEQLPTYLMPLTEANHAEMQAAFDRLSEGNTPTQDAVPLGSRHIVVRWRAPGVAWFDFAQLCLSPHSQNDFLELTQLFHTVLISNIPRMDEHMGNPARRFTLLIDVLYDRRVKLIASAEVAPHELYTKGMLAHEFVRTVSRLSEMQTQAYMQLGRREVDTRLTIGPADV